MAKLGERRTARAAVRRKFQTGATATTEEALVIERLGHDGRGIARDVNGKTVFVTQALPGEKVEVAVHRAHRRYDEAHVKRLISTASARVEPHCVHFGLCGGCDLQHLAIDEQRHHKHVVLQEHFSRQQLTLPAIETIADEPYGYRRRARLGIKLDSQGTLHLGYRMRGSDRLFDVTQCPILVPELERLIPELRMHLETLEAPRRLGHIELIAADNTRALVVRQLKEVPRDIERWQAFASRQGVALVVIEGREQPVMRQLVGNETLTYRLDVSADQAALTLSFLPGDFLQVNGTVNSALVSTALEWLDVKAGTVAFDLFAGIGNFTLPLAQCGARVTGIEGREAMVERLLSNARANGLHDVEAYQADLGQYPPGLDQASLVVLDPPRDGALAICQGLAERGPERVLYVSCEPATLARDAAVLVAGGYRIVKAAVADMFPQTAHLESLLLFER